MKVKLISVLMIVILSSCYANFPTNEIPKDNNTDIKTDNKQDVKTSVSNAPIAIVNTPMPTPVVTKAPIEENDNTKLSSNNLNQPQVSPTPIPTFLPTNTQPLPAPSNYGIACTSADFSSSLKNNLNDVYNPEDYKSDIMTFLKSSGEIYVSLGFKNEYKIRQLSLLTKKEEDKFTFVSQSCFDTTKLNNIIKSSSTIGIYDRLNGRTVEDIELQEDSYRDEMIREGILSRLSRYTLSIKSEPTEEGYNKVNDLLLKLRDIEVFKYISPNQIGTVS